MMDANLDQPFYDPSMVNIPPNFIPQNGIFPPLQRNINLSRRPKQRNSSFLSRIPSLHLPAILLLAFSWIIHTIATFIPYWSIYPSINDARAGLWSARNFNYTTIQNFYFPEATDFPNLTHSIGFTGANTKGYLVTVQFLMTFNFVIMTILLFLLIVDYIVSKRSADEPRSALIRRYNTSDTALIYGLLLYILYVLTVFEFAAWITYVGSRHDNNWHMHASFGLTVVVSAFLTIVFFMYVIEFLKIFSNNRLRWEYWYGPYAEWAFFVYLSALLLLLLVICCPEWAYLKYGPLNIFAEIGLFKQCYLSSIYKKSISSGLCTLSNSHSNRAWVDATQAFMLMAYIFGMIFLAIIVIFRKEFRHNQDGYHSDRVSQPIFTFVIAGLILFFCFIFSLIGVAIFGGEVFPNSLTVNWGYIVAVFAMVLFLIAGILFILDGIHSGRQASAETSSSAQKFFFPEPLNNRVMAMQPLIKPEPAWQPSPLPPPPLSMPLEAPPPWQSMAPFNFPQQQPSPMYPGAFFPPEQMLVTPTNYGMEQYPLAPLAPITHATLSNYFQQMVNNPQLSSLPSNQGLGNYSGNNPFTNTQNNIMYNNLNEMVRRHFLQQQRLNYNHERLLERYSQLRAPRISEYHPFGTSTLPGRNYDEYLQRMRGDDDDLYENSIAAQSRAGIGSSDETYRWMDNDYSEPLPRGVNSAMQHSRNDPRPFVNAEKIEPVKIYNHPIFGLTPAYIRLVFKKIKSSKKENEKEMKLDHEEEKKRLTTINDDRQNWKTNNEHLIPVNPLLFNIYNQRLNGYIQGYGQSLYIPPSYYNYDRQLSYYEDIVTSSRSYADSVLAFSSSPPKHRYRKLHLQPTVTTMPVEPIEHLTSDNDGDLSGNDIRQSDSSTPRLSRNNPNSLTFSAPLTCHVASFTTTADILSTKNLPVVNHAELITSDPLMSESASIFNSMIPSETLSNDEKKFTKTTNNDLDIKLTSTED